MVSKSGKTWGTGAGSFRERGRTIGWNDLPDLSKIKTKEELTKLHAKVYPTAKKMQAVNEVGQIWRFIHEIQKGDLVALPLKKQSAVAIGEVRREYEYNELANNIKHIRRVKWLKTILRSAFDQDILYSLGAFMTVCQISRNDAENRVKEILRKKVPPEVVEGPGEEAIDVEEYAKDQIVKYIGQSSKVTI